MSKLIQKAPRNQSMECCKLLASIFVVFIHVQFPGNFGSLMSCLARFGVPMFFAISGYFNFQATPRQLRRRLSHILKLMLSGYVLALLWVCCTTDIAALPGKLYAGIPDTKELLSWLVLHISPYTLTRQLWYLMSLIVCYGVLWAYTCFRGESSVRYGPLYCAGFLLFTVHFTLALVLPAVNVVVPYWSYRNGWFTGLPMFLMGMFLHEYQDQILQNFALTTKKLTAILLLGLFLTLAQWRSGTSPEIPLGTLIQVPALLLLTIVNPRLSPQNSWFCRFSGTFSTLSSTVYLVHLIVDQIYETFLLVPMEGIFSGKEPWIRPLAVVSLSILTGLLWVGIQNLFRKKP